MKQETDNDEIKRDAVAAAATQSAHYQTESGKGILASTTVPNISEKTVVVIVRLASARAAGEEEGCVVAP